MSSTTRAATATTTSQVALKGLEHMFFLIGFLWNRVCPWDIEIHVINERKTNLFTTEAAFTWFLYRHSCIVITMGSSHNEEQLVSERISVAKKKRKKKKRNFSSVEPMRIEMEIYWQSVSWSPPLPPPSTPPWG